MRYIVDANVLSEATKPSPSGKVIDWLNKHESELAINPIIAGELQYGILLLPSGKKRERLLSWIAAGIEHLAMLDLDAETAAHWSRLLAHLKRKGYSMPVKDSLIAASAKQHGLFVATRNTRDFAHAGVRLVNPFE